MNFAPDPKQKWERLSFDEEKLKSLSVRQQFEIEANRDLLKPIEQLVCDVHEETHNPARTELQNLTGAQKRMVSMMARIAISNDKLSSQMVVLNWLIAIMTLVILFFTILMCVKS